MKKTASTEKKRTLSRRRLVLNKVSIRELTPRPGKDVKGGLLGRDYTAGKHRC